MTARRRTFEGFCFALFCLLTLFLGSIVTLNGFHFFEVFHRISQEFFGLHQFDGTDFVNRYRDVEGIVVVSTFFKILAWGMPVL